MSACRVRSKQAVPSGVLPLLELPSGIITEWIVPRLRPHQQAALSLTCKALRSAVAGAVRELVLPGGRCCPAVHCNLHLAFPAVRTISLTPSNLHEAMNVLPSLLMTMGQGLNTLSRVVLHDKLPDEPSERRKCDSCNAWRNTYDLAAIVFTVHGCLAAQLREFDFATHFISNAECMAIGNMTGLTSLRCSSPHGFCAGGLASFSRLTRLRQLEVTDAPRTWTPEDVEAVAGMTALTRLVISSSTTMLRPLLRRIGAVNGCCTEADKGSTAAGARRGFAPPPQQQQQQRAMAASSSSRQQEQQLPQHDQSAAGGLQLLELEVSFDWLQSSNAELLLAIGKLTSLTSLQISWLGQSAHNSTMSRRAPLRSCSSLKSLSTLRNLSQLNAAWPVDCGVFDALRQLSALTAVTLGTLPLTPAAAQGAVAPAAPPAPAARLARVLRLAVYSSRWMAGRHPWHELSPERQRLMGLDGAHTAQWVDALVAFPSLECLSLDTGAVRAESLRRLPAVAPRLRQLLLPARLHAGVRGDALRALGQLAGLTRLRVGWKSALDEGPPAEVVQWDPAPLTLPDVFCAPAPAHQGCSVQGARPARRRSHRKAAGAGSVSGSNSIVDSGGGCAAYVAAPAAAPAVAPQRRMTLRSSGRGPQVAASAPAPAPLPVLQQPAAKQAFYSSQAATPGTSATPAGASAAEQPPGCAAAAGTPAAAGAVTAAPSSPPYAGAMARVFPALRSLEVSGPAHFAQIAALCGLPACVTELVISDNPSWSSGMCHDALLAAAQAPGLRRLAVRRCRGVQEAALETALMWQGCRPTGGPSTARGRPDLQQQERHARELRLDLELEFEPFPPPPWPHADHWGVFPLMMGPAPAGFLNVPPPGDAGWLFDFGAAVGGGFDDDDDMGFGWGFFPAAPQLAPLAPVPQAGGLGGGGGGPLGPAGGGAGMVAGELVGAAAAAVALQQQAAAAQAQLQHLHEQLGLLVPPGLLGMMPEGIPVMGGAGGAGGAGAGQGVAGAANAAAGQAAAGALAAVAQAGGAAAAAAAGAMLGMLGDGGAAAGGADDAVPLLFADGADDAAAMFIG